MFPSLPLTFKYIYLAYIFRNAIASYLTQKKELFPVLLLSSVPPITAESNN